VALPALAVPLVALPLAKATGPGDSSLPIAVVQGNVPRLGLDFNAQRAAVLNNHVQGTLQLADKIQAGEVPKPAFVIWPENSSDIDPLQDGDARQAIDAAVNAVDVPILVGAVLEGPGNNLRNTGIVWDPGTGPGQMYVKQHPVPFGEYIPLRGLARLVSKDVDRVRQDFIGGTEPGRLTIGGQRIGDVICFEVAYDGIVRSAAGDGAGLLVVQTNNATFDRSGETYQQLAMAQLRAVEFGRTTVVSATSGISAVIAPDGRILDQSAIFTADLLAGAVPIRTGHTLAERLGPLPEWLLSLLGAGVLGWALFGGRLRRRFGEPEESEHYLGGRHAAGRRTRAGAAGGVSRDRDGDTLAGEPLADEDEETQTV
jgi:apolipoprotein N-acyltransferase